MYDFTISRDEYPDHQFELMRFMYEQGGGSGTLRNERISITANTPAAQQHAGAVLRGVDHVYPFTAGSEGIKNFYEECVEMGLTFSEDPTE